MIAEQERLKKCWRMSDMKTAIEIVKKYLIENKCDGLFSDDCGCRVDDLAPCGPPCGGDFSQCKPGVVIREDDENVFWRKHEG